MVISALLKLQKTVNDLRSNVATPDWISLTTTSFKEEDVTLEASETKSLSCDVGMILVSEYDLDITGDITKTVSKLLVCFSALSITITNNESTDITFTAYTLD